MIPLHSPKGAVEVVESEHDITIQDVETLSSRSLVIIKAVSSLFQEHKQFAQERINRSHNSTCWYCLQETVHEVLPPLGNPTRTTTGIS